MRTLTADERATLDLLTIRVILEYVVERLGMTRGRQRIDIEFADGVYQSGYLGRVKVAADDLEAAAG